jgi:predicted transcriptional regulator
MLRILIVIVVLGAGTHSFATSESDIKKTQLEDIFIWKMSDELKLTAQQEKAFTELSKSLNKKKSELNKQIQDAVQNLGGKNQEADLLKYRKLINEYSQLSVKEFDSIKRLLGSEKFTEYLKIKYELTSKVKSILVGDKPADKKEQPVSLPPPKVIVEK